MEICSRRVANSPASHTGELREKWINRSVGCAEL